MVSDGVFKALAIIAPLSTWMENGEFESTMEHARPVHAEAP